MSANPPPIVRMKGTVKEHLAGIHAAQVWIQDLAAQHLLDTQQPIREQPLPDSDVPKP